MSTSPSSSSIPFSPLKSSPPRLPVEVLHHVIEQSVPSYYHSLTYDDRQATLRNLCLTSRLFRQIAQPLLEQFDQIHLLDEDDDDSEMCDISPRTLRTQTLSVLSREGIGPRGIESLVYAYYSVRELHITVEKMDGLRMELSPLAFMTSLTDLSMRGALLYMEAPTPLSAIRQLTLIDCDDGVVFTILKPSIFPSLKILALLDTASPKAEFESLLPQLDLLIISPWQAEAPEFDGFGDKILTDCPFLVMEEGKDEFPITQHFRLRCKPLDMCSKINVEVLREAFDVVHNVRDNSGVPLKTLFLDYGLYNALDRLEGMQSQYDRLIEMCERDGTEIILEEQMTSGFADSAITPELLRWIDRRKEKAKVESEGEV